MKNSNATRGDRLKQRNKRKEKQMKALAKKKQNDKKLNEKTELLLQKKLDDKNKNEIQVQKNSKIPSKKKKLKSPKIKAELEILITKCLNAEKKYKEMKPKLIKRKFHQTTMASKEFSKIKPLQKAMIEPKPYVELFKRIKTLMIYGTITENNLVKFLNKQEKLHRKSQLKLLSNVPVIKPKKTQRSQSTCMKCFEIGHKSKQCTNNDPESEIRRRKEQWLSRKQEGKRNYNKRYKNRRAFNRNLKKKQSKEQIVENKQK